MFKRIIEFVKTHPKTAAGVCIGTLLLFIILVSGGSKKTSGQAVIVTQPQTDTSQNTALMAAQLNAQVQTNAVNQSAAVQMAGINAAQSVQNTQSTNATNVALARIAGQVDTVKYVTDLNAQVENNKTNAAVTINGVQMSAAQQIATIQANADTTLATISSHMNENNNATVLSLANISADTTKYLGNQNYNATLNAQSLNYQLSKAGLEVSSAASQALGANWQYKPQLLPGQAA